MKKNTGKRTRPIVRTEREQIVKRLKQAQRACDDGRNVESNGTRITRLLARLVEIDTQPEPVVPVEEPPAPSQEYLDEIGESQSAEVLYSETAAA